MNVSIFGAGYVGLVQGAVLANVGHHVLCIDVDSDKISQLKKGIIPIFEPGLASLISKAQAIGKLDFTSNVVDGVLHGEIQYIAVGTPSDEDGSADLRYVLAVAETIANHMNGYRVIVTKSTVPVGTADLARNKVHAVLKSRGVAYEFDVVSNPEFLKEGAAIVDCQHPDRIILGTDSQRAEGLLRELYESFNQTQDKIIVMDVRSAELTKYAANCMLATKISFINEVSNLAEKLGADIEAVRLGIGSDPRIGYHFIHPGLGYGGSCFPKDVQALIHMADNLDFDAKLLKAVAARNHEQKAILFKKINQYFCGNLKDKTIALWGLSFKPNTDDMREAPSRLLIDALLKAGARVMAYDPVAKNEATRIYKQRNELVIVDTKEDALVGADALAIVTEWQEFRDPNFNLIKQTLKQPVIFDGRNLYDPEMMINKGFFYQSIGYGKKISTKLPMKSQVVLND